MKKLLLQYVTISLLSMLLGFLIGVFAVSKDRQLKEAADVQAGESLKPISVEHVVTFSTCGHSCTHSIGMMIMSEEALAQLYDRYSEAEQRLTETGIRFYEVLDGWCPLHYRLVLDADGQLELLHTNADTFMEEILLLIESSDTEIHMEELRACGGMIVFDSSEEADQYFESLGS